ncbi:MAG: hypothetical protein HDKAJFGB_01950 [Anaerolineae bacterium]|nr:hypothetical protein [Anaerolineae bacterium]RIK33670.1 MAG: hypothetical protein DCC52_02625 [Chloroflexota bacterium]
MSAAPPVSPMYRPPGRPVDVRKILRRHRPFLGVAALALAGLVAIEAWGVAQFFPAAQNAWLGALAILIALLGNGAAFLLPPRWVIPEKFPRPVGAFAQATAYGAVISLASFALIFFVLWLQAGWTLDAATLLLKDLYFYALVTVVLFHGLVYYVRQMHWLYEEFGGADSPLKPIAASGGIGLMIFVVTIVFLPLDLQTITNAPPDLRGVVGLFTYGRDLYLLTLALGAYAWHFRWVADH